LILNHETGDIHEVSSPSPIISVALLPDMTIKTETSSGVYIFSEKNTPTMNPRFTNFLDFGPYFRLGYIAADDLTRRSLANLSGSSPTLILLDRRTGKSEIISQTLKVDSMIYFDGVPLIQTKDGVFFTIKR
jgi:hypothetical protein